MAPSAVSIEPSPSISPAILNGKDFGNYKEQAAGAKTFNKKLEEEGDADHAPAKVYSSCDWMFSRLTDRSTSITSRPGMRN